MTTPKTLTIQETHALLDALLVKQGTPKQFRRGVRNYSIGCLMVEAGLRVGEVTRLKWRHLFFNSQPVTSIIISPEIAEKEADREIPVSQRLCNALSQYAEYYSPSLPEFTAYFAFYTKYPLHPLTTRQVERIINSAAMKALGRPVHPHILRHTFASKLARVTNIRTVQELLGHKHITSTQIYTHPNSEDKKKAIAAAEKNDSNDLPPDMELFSRTNTLQLPDTSTTHGNVR